MKKTPLLVIKMIKCTLIFNLKKNWVKFRELKKGC